MAAVASVAFVAAVAAAATGRSPFATTRLLIENPTGLSTSSRTVMPLAAVTPPAAVPTELAWDPARAGESEVVIAAAAAGVPSLLGDSENDDAAPVEDIGAEDQRMVFAWPAACGDVVDENDAPAVAVAAAAEAALGTCDMMMAAPRCVDCGVKPGGTRGGLKLSSSNSENAGVCDDIRRCARP